MTIVTFKKHYVIAIPEWRLTEIQPPTCPLISITSARNYFRSVPKWAESALMLAFDDADPDIPARHWDHAKLFTSADADLIVAFVKRAPEARGFVVNCEAGASRSPAIAAAITLFLGGDDADFWRDQDPNRYVYRLMCDSFEIVPDWDRISTIIEERKKDTTTPAIWGDENQ